MLPAESCVAAFFRSPSSLSWEPGGSRPPRSSKLRKSLSEASIHFGFQLLQKWLVDSFSA